MVMKMGMNSNRQIRKPSGFKCFIFCRTV